MALLHQATLTPTKIELVRAWLPAQSWFEGDPAVELVGAYRFDDPAGEVGVETLLVAAADGVVVQVPVTYRDAPLAGAEQHLIGTSLHSVLGDRWVYDGLGDPVYLAAVATAIGTGGRQADLLIEIDGEMVTREPTARVQGSGTGGGAVSVVRYPTPATPPAPASLTGTWAGQDEPVVLVTLA
jgi:hypothetical protein